MPAMFSDDEKGKGRTVRGHSAYLSSLGKPVECRTSRRQSSTRTTLKESMARGAKLYLTAGCATCHGDQLTAPPTKKKKDDDDEDEKPFDPSGSCVRRRHRHRPAGVLHAQPRRQQNEPDGAGEVAEEPARDEPARADAEHAVDRRRGARPGQPPVQNHRREDQSAKMPEAPEVDAESALADRRHPGKTAAANLHHPVTRSGGGANGVRSRKGCMNCHAVEDPVAMCQSQVEPFRRNWPPKLTKPPPCRRAAFAEKPTAPKPRTTPSTPTRRAALTAFLKDGLKRRRVDRRRFTRRRWRSSGSTA